MGMVMRNLRYAVRTLWRAPGFTSLVVLTLGIGIGADTAMFSIVDAVLLRRLPYPDAERLVTVSRDGTARGGEPRERIAASLYRDLRDERGLFEAVAVWQRWTPTLGGVEQPEVLEGATVTPEMFSRVLRVRPVLGRDLLPADDLDGAPSVVLLSHAAWTTRFGADPDIVGRSVSLSDMPHVVVGVLPEGFRPPFLPDAEMWRARGGAAPGYCEPECRPWSALARLASGVTLPQARARTAALAARRAEAYPETEAATAIGLIALRDDLTHEVARPLWILFAAVGCVLLIACANVANLLLVRGTAREPELALRIALGSGRWPLLVQVLAESLVLAALGAVAGLGLAAWGTSAVLALAPAGALPSAVPISGRVLAFTAGVAGLTGVLFGLVPAWRASGGDVQPRLRAARGRRGLLEGGWIVAGAQIAVALVLCVGAGLLARSLQRLDHVDLGFRPAGVLAVRVTLPPTRYQGRGVWGAYERALLGRLGAIPGVRVVGAGAGLPFMGVEADTRFRLEGEAPAEDGDAPAAGLRPVTEGYFEALGVEILAGRPFEATDDPGSGFVAVVSQTFARRWFPDGDAVGRRIALGVGEHPRWHTIVGIAHDVRRSGVRAPTRPAIYVPYSQNPGQEIAIALAVDADPTAVIDEARRAVTSVDAGVAPAVLQPLAGVVEAALAPDRFLRDLLSLFAAAALLLAAVGVYGVIAHGVARRARETGIRVVLGADRSVLLRGVIARALALATAGIGLGMLGAFALRRVVASILFEVTPTDPLSFGATIGVLTVVTVLASLVPARRAGRADGRTALRP